MKAIRRLSQYIDFKQYKPAVFERNIGLSNGYIGKQKKRNADIGEGIILKIISNCPDLSIDWLLTGEGEMLKKKTSEGRRTVQLKKESLEDIIAERVLAKLNLKPLEDLYKLNDIQIEILERLEEVESELNAVKKKLS